MILWKAVTFASILMIMFSAISALPGIIRERHVIHAPIKIKTIHHYRLKKVPIVIRKHVHVYRAREEDRHPNHVLEEEEEEEEERREGGPQGPGAPEDSHEAPEEDYEGPSHSGEDDYDENYEYE